MKKLLLLLVFSGFTFLKAQDNGLSFDNIDDQVTVPLASDLITGSTNLSMTCWVYPENLVSTFPDYDGFCGFRNDIDADFYLVQIPPGNKVEARFRNSAGNAFDVVDSSLLLNTWQHYALTYDGTTLRVYKNGILMASAGAAGSIASNSETFYIGNIIYTFNDFFLKGKLDEVSLWTKTLSQQEIQCIYESYIDAGSPGLVMYYKFDQGIAGGNNISVNTLLAEVGPNGTLQNFALNGNSSNWVDGIQNYTSTQDVICEGQSILFGSHFLTESGIYFETFTGASGCDSIVRMDLDPAVDSTISQSGSSLSANQVGGSYQWLDCSNFYAVIPGETSRIFSPSSNGVYAASITYNGCTDTSICLNILNAGIEQIAHTISTVGNPVSDVLELKGAAGYRFSLFDAYGRKVIADRWIGDSGVDVHHLSPGIYFIRLHNSKSSYTVPMVKE